MRRFLRLKTASMLIASLALVFPGRLQAASPGMPAAVQQTTPAAPAAQPLIADIALGDDGRLRGQAVDSAGVPAAGKSVAVIQQGREVAHTQTDAAGRFTIDHLTGGVYEVHCDQGNTVARLWAPRTAPPAARPALLVSCGQPVVRGQHTFGPYDGSWMKGRGPWIIAAVAIVAVPTALALTLRPKSSAS